MSELSVVIPTYNRADALQQCLTHLAAQTRLWRDTWYDSTLPHWFLDRTFANASIPATSTCYRFADGRSYAWEGVSCCAGTCTHVWHYAQALARLFPELERITRERVDLGIAFHPESGVMGFRAEFDRNLAVDGQSGTLLRIYREHQMSGDDGFLKRNWPRIRKAFEPLRVTTVIVAPELRPYSAWKFDVWTLISAIESSAGAA